MRNRSRVQPKQVTPSLPSLPCCAKNAWPRTTRSVPPEGREGQRNWGAPSPSQPRLHPHKGKPAVGWVPAKPTKELGPEGAPERSGPTTMQSRCLERIKYHEWCTINYISWFDHRLLEQVGWSPMTRYISSNNDLRTEFITSKNNNIQYS